jgi:metallo-beta-lactamase class B
MKMKNRVALALVLLTLVASTGRSQTNQYRSPAGVQYRSQADTGPIARAEQALAADPRNIQKFIALGTAQAGARQMQEAVQTFTRAMAVEPNNPMVYRWRGHRNISVRNYDQAMADLTKGYGLDSTNYGILYHLGVLRFLRRDFNGAADAFRRAQPRAPDAGELKGSTDWLWMSLMRAGRASEAAAMLARRPDTLVISNAYDRRLRLYRGEIGPEAVLTSTDTGDVDVATLAFGLGNWYLLKGDTVKARALFERSVASGGWPAFGFMASEVELAALRAKECPSCASWTAPHAPLKLFGNAYYVGSNGLSAILLTSNAGHILLDAALPESAEQIMESIRTLGFRVEDVKLIVNSHAHYDHSGGIAAIQAKSGAEVAASPPSAREFQRGGAEPDDPQFGTALDYPKISKVRVIRDGETLRVGPLAITGHFTGGHTPGGTSWTWKSCENSNCREMVYADSFTPISAPQFLYTKSTTYPKALADFEKSYAFLESTPCEILITPHPAVSSLWERVADREADKAADIRSDGACKRYAASARASLAKRVADERSK